MKNILFSILLVCSSSAMAGQFEMMKEDLSSPQYQMNITYPILNLNSVPAYLKINESLKAKIISGGCNPQDAAQTISGMDYQSLVVIVGLNKNYVAYSMAYDYSCGGAHPATGIEYITYDSMTGEEMIMENEFPGQKLDVESETGLQKFHKYQKKLAEIMFKNLPFTLKEIPSDCIEGESHEEYIESLMRLNPLVSGLAKSKQVVISLNPPHAMAVCGMSVRVSYKDVSKLIASKSILHKWLK